jgi:hypothetical protein
MISDVDVATPASSTAPKKRPIVLAEVRRYHPIKHPQHVSGSHRLTTETGAAYS